MEILGPFKVLQQPLVLAARGSAPKTGSPPVAWWKFDEASGDTVADAADKKHHGKIQGPVRWTKTANQSGALDLDGTSTWIEAEESHDIEFSRGVTVAAWFKCNPSDGSQETLIAKGNSWALHRVGAPSRIEFALTGPQSGVLSSQTPLVGTKKPIDDGQWHQVVASYDGRKMVIYLDGAEERSIRASGALTMNNLPVTLGENDGNRGRLLTGSIAETRLFNYGVSAEQARALYQEGGPARE